MKISLLIIIGSIVFTACQEIYDPDINTDLSVLSVESLITDKTNPFLAHIGIAIPFDSSGIGIPVKGAEVFISDDLSHKFPLIEKENGNYVSGNIDFNIQPGRKYSLKISTPDGNQYGSASQELIPNVEISDIYGRLTYKTHIWKNQNGEYTQVDNEGIETFIDFHTDQGQSLRFKFKVKLMIEYTYKYDITDDPLKKRKFYAWRKYDLNEDINITESGFENERNEIINHTLAFFPIHESFYQLQTDMYQEDFHLMHWILIIEQFRLNEDSYSFYKKAKKQLAAEGKLFDPISEQINGNISCINNPAKLVLGFFEVSSKETISYIATPDWPSKTVNYKKIPNLLNIPDEGAVELKFLPDWWIY